MARRYGWPEEVLQNLEQWESLDLDERTRLGLRFAEEMTRNAQGIDEAFFSALRAEFDEGEVVEMAAVIGLFNYFNRFNDALGIEPTKAGER